jgi:hypothetical protein
MRLQSKSLASAFSFGRATRSQAATMEMNARSAEADTRSTPHLQSLATELHQSAVQGEFDFPQRWVFISRAIAITLVALALIRVAIMVLSILNNGHGIVAGLLNWTVLGVVVGVAFSLTVAALLVNLFPSVRVTPYGMGISEMFGWRRIPWEQVSVLRVMELPNQGRYVVLVPFKGQTRPHTPAPMLKIIPALVGAAPNGEQGVLLTSDIKDFDRLLQLILSYVTQASGHGMQAAGAFINEEVVMPVAQLVLDPDGALARTSRHVDASLDPYGVTATEEEPGALWAVPLREMLVKQLPIALAPVLMMAVDVMARNTEKAATWGHLPWMVVLLALGLAELPFVAKLVQAVGEMMVGTGQYTCTVKAYVELQAPRAFMIVVGTAMLGVGLPASLAQMCWFVGILITSLLTTRYVHRLYYIPLTHALIAGIGAFIFQVSLLALYFGVR